MVMSRSRRFRPRRPRRVRAPSAVVRDIFGMVFHRGVSDCSVFMQTARRGSIEPLCLRDLAGTDRRSIGARLRTIHGPRDHPVFTFQGLRLPFSLKRTAAKSTRPPLLKRRKRRLAVRSETDRLAPLASARLPLSIGESFLPLIRQETRCVSGNGARQESRLQPSRRRGSDASASRFRSVERR